METVCLNCKRTFNADRTDAVFCSDPCKASWFRNHGATGKHADKIRFKSKACEYCSKQFWFNEYGDRGGQRVPTYCTDTCRVAAWRAGQADKKRRAEQARKDERSWDAKKEQARREAPKQEAPKYEPHRPNNEQQWSEDFRDKLKIPRYWSSETCYMWIFGSPARKSKKEVNLAMRMLNRIHHPDANNGKAYKHLSTLNAAWDYLKRNVFINE